MALGDVSATSLSAVLIAVCSPAIAGWDFNGSPSPNAFIQSGNMSLELQCVFAVD